MSNTCYNGKNGALAVGATNIAQLTNWTITENVDTVECSFMGASWKEYKAGVREFEGSAEAIYDGNDQGLATPLATGATVALTAYPESGDTDHSLSGNAIVTSIEYTADLDDVVRMSVSFTGTGALTVDTEDNA